MYEQFIASTASHSLDEMVKGKQHHHISNCSCFNSISPQFLISPWEGGASSCLTVYPLSRPGQTITQSNAYLTSNLNSISLSWIHTNIDHNHRKRGLTSECVCEKNKRARQSLLNLCIRIFVFISSKYKFRSNYSLLS